EPGVGAGHEHVVALAGEVGGALPRAVRRAAAQVVAQERLLLLGRKRREAVGGHRSPPSARASARRPMPARLAMLSGCGTPKSIMQAISVAPARTKSRARSRQVSSEPKSVLRWKYRSKMSSSSLSWLAPESMRRPSTVCFQRLCTE